MQNGFMSKAGAGLGQGMAVAGQMAYHSQLAGDLERQRGEIMGQLEQVKQAGENARNAATNATHLESTRMSGEAHVKGMELYANQRENKLIYHDGVVFKDGVVDEDASKIAGELTKRFGPKKTPQLLQDMQGLVDAGVATDMSDAFLKLHPDKEQGLDKVTKDTDQRVQMFAGMVDKHMGVGFLEKLDDAQRKEFDTLLTNGADQVRKGADPEKAFRSSLDAFNRVKAQSGIKGDSGANSTAQSFREKYGY